MKPQKYEKSMEKVQNEQKYGKSMEKVWKKYGKSMEKVQIRKADLLSPRASQKDL